jgi:hypothetical protein
MGMPSGTLASCCVILKTTDLWQSIDRTAMAIVGGRASSNLRSISVSKINFAMPPLTLITEWPQFTSLHGDGGGEWECLRGPLQAALSP